VSPSVYVTGQGFGVTWRIGYARVSPPQRITARDVFADEIRQEVTNKGSATARALMTDEDDNEIDEIMGEAQESSVQVPTEPAEEAPAPAASAPAPAAAPASKNRRRVVAAA